MNAIAFPITPTRAQLALAQVAGSVEFGQTLTAVRLEDGWKYIVSWGDVVGLVCYAGDGYEAAIEALNSDE